MNEVSYSPTADNRAYLASCYRHYIQILLRRTSNTLGTLSEIAGDGIEELKK